MKVIYACYLYLYVFYCSSGYNVLDAGPGSELLQPLQLQRSPPTVLPATVTFSTHALVLPYRHGIAAWFSFQVPPSHYSPRAQDSRGRSSPK